MKTALALPFCILALATTALHAGWGPRGVPEAEEEEPQPTPPTVYTGGSGSYSTGGSYYGSVSVSGGSLTKSGVGSVSIGSGSVGSGSVGSGSVGSGSVGSGSVGSVSGGEGPSYPQGGDTPPPPSPPPSDWWESVDEEAGLRNTTTYGEAGIGWISDKHFPWVFTYGLGEGEWIYIFETDSDRRGFNAYRPETENFLWASSQWGWYYEMGSDNGWNAFKN